MKKVIITSFILVMVLSIGAAFANPQGVCEDGKLIGKVNIIGVKDPKKTDMDTEEQGHGVGSVIFVDLYGKNNIYLVDSNEVDGLDADDFEVLDKNATDSDGGLLALPKPGLDPYIIGNADGNDTISEYSVFVRALGKPSKEGDLRFAEIRTCADLIDSTIGGLLGGKNTNLVEDTTYCSIEQVGQSITLREKGKKPTFTNVTAELLTIVLEVELYDSEGNYVETIYVRIPIFDDSLENEYWEYTDHGLKLLQVRFYDCPYNVQDSDGPYLPD